MATDTSSFRAGFFIHSVSRSDLRPGDHIYCYRLGYSHHGIYVGKRGREVIHLSGAPGQFKSKESAHVRADTLEDFLDGDQLRLVAYDVSWLEKKIKLGTTCHTDKSRPAEKVIKTAEYYLDNPREFGEYNAIFNNCEKFAIYCKTGIEVAVAQQVPGSGILNGLYSLLQQ